VVFEGLVQPLFAFGAGFEENGVLKELSLNKSLDF